MPHLSDGQKGDFNALAKSATWTHPLPDNTTEELPLAWVRKKVDMRYYGKPNGQHDPSEEEDIQEVLEAYSYDSLGNAVKKYTIFEDEPPKPKKKGKVKIEDV